MKKIDVKYIRDTVAEMCIEANTVLTDDILKEMEVALAREKSPSAIAILETMIENFEVAEKKEIPICQDTGMAVVFVTMGQDLQITGGSLEDAIQDLSLIHIFWNMAFISKISEVLKKSRPNCVVFWGGPEVSYDSGRLLEEHPFVDYIISGEGETVFPEFIETLQGRDKTPLLKMENVNWFGRNVSHSHICLLYTS